MFNNYMEMKFLGISANESYARVCAGAFAAQLDPTMEEINDIKTAVSEAVTNCIVHAYPDGAGEICIRCELENGIFTVVISDRGRGIADIKQALIPFYSTADNDERSGMGFTVMQSFMDSVDVESTPGVGTCVTMRKSMQLK